MVKIIDAAHLSVFTIKENEENIDSMFVVSHHSILVKTKKNQISRTFQKKNINLIKQAAKYVRSPQE